MAFLLDTNVVSEWRKKRRAHPNFLNWFAHHFAERKFISVITLGEIRRGIEGVRPRDLAQALAIENWLANVKHEFRNHILPVTAAIADRWGRFDSRQPLPVDDGLIAATALEHDLTIVTRNVADFERSGATIVNPFE